MLKLSMFMWTPTVAGEGSRTYLAAHCTVDGDDDKALDRVKDGKEDLEEDRR